MPRRLSCLSRRGDAPPRRTVKADEGVERPVRAKCLNLAGGEGVKARGNTLSICDGQITSWRSYTIVPSSLLVRVKSFTPSQVADFKGLRSEEPSLRVHLPSPARACGPVADRCCGPSWLQRREEANQTPVSGTQSCCCERRSRLKAAASLGSVDRTKKPYRVNVLRSV
jgi:hypothetical protein